MPEKLPIIVFSIVLLALVPACAPNRLSAAAPNKADLLTNEERRWLEAHDGMIRFAPSPAYAPVCFRDADGRFQGITMDYARHMEATLGFRFKIVVCESWGEIMEKARSKEIDVIGNIQPTEERAKYLRFTAPYLTIPNAIITRKEVRRPLSLDTMSGVRVAAVEGYATVAYIKNNFPQIDLTLVPDNIEGLQAVSFGRLDAMVTDLAIASYTINHYGITNLKMTGTIPEFTWRLSFAGRRDWPVLQHILEKGLNAVSAVERQKIQHQWISIEKPSPLYRDPRFYLAVGMTLLFGLLVCVVWTRALHRLVSKRTNELRLSEIRYRSISEDMPVMICRFLPGGELTYVNAAYSKYFAQTPEDLTGSCFFSLIPEEDHTQVMDALSTLTPESPTQSHDHRVHAPNGETRWQRWTNRAQFDAQGNAVSFQSIGEDITEWKQTTQRLSHVIQGINAGTWEWNVQTGEIIFNERWADIIGYTLDEISPVSIKTWTKFCHPDDIEESKQRLRRCFNGRAEYYTYESRMRHKNGEWIWVLDSGKVITWTQDGKPEWMYGTHQDISERKDAEAKLKANEAKLRLMIEQSPLGVCINDLDGRFISVNPAYQKLTGYTEEELKKRTFFDITHPDDRPEDRRLFHDMTFKKAAPFRIKKRYIRKDGVEISVIIHAGLICDPSGVPLFELSLIEDTTERKKAKKEREELQEKLSQAQKMEAIGRLAGGVAHDFNNMLTIILGNTEMAMGYLDPKHPVHNDLEEIKKAAERSTNLVRQLLAFARKQTISPKVLDLNTTVTGMIKMLKRLIGENIDLAWVPSKEVWPVKIDPSQIDQILANLCLNARDAIAGVGKMTIETGNATFDEAYCAAREGFKPGEYAMLAVSDNGCGMDARTLNKVFEPFFTTKAQDKGTGLGLSTVYGVVKQNLGFINVYSEPGKGTTFKIYLPHHRTEAAPLPEQRPEIQADGGHETILLVEDEPSILKVTMGMLELKGYTLIAAATPGEAIDIAHTYSSEIHLLMTDVVMPQMNGRDLAENICNHRPNLKCLFMSGYTANVIAHHGVLDQGVNFIQKPFTMDSLFAKVRQVLDEG
ncbi:MAG: PAS domain S-box protein [Desulfobacterales bacterium]|nr:PAS domain S-box protein [Desulfobacterales bacterium]